MELSDLSAVKPQSQLGTGRSGGTGASLLDASVYNSLGRPCFRQTPPNTCLASNKTVVIKHQSKDADYIKQKINTKAN